MGSQFQLKWFIIFTQYLEYVPWNCLPLTNRKHNTFHDRNNDKIIGNGIYWQKKRKKEFLNFFKNKNEK